MEDIKPLRLKSPCGQGYISFNWDESINNKLPSDSIMETIRWVCKEVPVLKSIIDIKVIRQIDRSNYADMQALCDRFNHVIDTFLSMSKGTSMVCGNPVASQDLLKWILEFVYTRVVSQPVLLNKCKANALPETYGETNYEQVRKIIQKLNMQPDDTFIDLGSGIGHIVLQVAASTQCRQSIGIEKESTRAEYAVEMDKEFKGVMKWFGKKFHNYQLINGDFLDPQHHDAIYQSTVIFVNNFAFREVNHKLKSLFANLDNNTRIISTYPFRSESFRVSDRNLDDTAAMMKVSKFLSEPGAFSWTPNPVPYYIQTIDRCVLQEYFDNKHINNEQKKSRHKLLNGLDNASNSGDTMDSVSETSSHKSFKTEPSHSNESTGSRFKHLNHHQGPPPPHHKQPRASNPIVPPALDNAVKGAVPNSNPRSVEAHNAIHHHNHHHHHVHQQEPKKRFKTLASQAGLGLSFKAREEGAAGLGKKKARPDVIPHNNGGAGNAKQPIKTNGGTLEKRRIAPTVKQSHRLPSSHSGAEDDPPRPAAKKRAHSPTPGKALAASVGDSGSGSSSSISLFSSPYTERKIAGPLRNDTASPDPIALKHKKHPTPLSNAATPGPTAKSYLGKGGQVNNGPCRRLSSPLENDTDQGPADMEMDEDVTFNSVKLGGGANSTIKKSLKSPKTLPTVLPLQTRVSVKGKGGSTCQAVITKVEPRLKVRVRLPQPIDKSVIVNHTAVLQGSLEVGSVVKVEQDMKIRKGTIEKIWDNSVYTIEMEDGEVRVVRRSMIHVVQLAMRNYSKQNRTFGLSTLDKLNNSLYAKTEKAVGVSSGKIQLYTSSSSSSGSGSSSSSTLSSPNPSRSCSRSRSSSASSLPSAKYLASPHHPQTTGKKKKVQTGKDANSSNFKSTLGSDFASSLDLLHQHTLRSVNAPLQHTEKKTREDVGQSLNDSIVIPRPEGMDSLLFNSLSSGINNVFQQWCKLYATLSALRQNDHQRLEDELITERVKGQQMNSKIGLAEQSKREIIADISALLQARMNRLDSSIVKPLNLSRFAKEVVNHQQNLKSTIIKIENEVDLLAQKNVEMREKMFALTGKDYYDPAGGSANPLQFYTEQIVNKLLHSSNAPHAPSSALLRPPPPFLPPNFKPAGPVQGLVNSGNLLFNNGNSPAAANSNMYLATAVKLMSAAPNFNPGPAKKPLIIPPSVPHQSLSQPLDPFNQQLLAHSTKHHHTTPSSPTHHKNKLQQPQQPGPSTCSSVAPKPTSTSNAQLKAGVSISSSNGCLLPSTSSNPLALPQLSSKYSAAPHQYHQQQQQVQPHSLTSSDLADPLACASYVKKVIAKAMEESQAAASCITTTTSSQHGFNYVSVSGNCSLPLPISLNSNGGVFNSTAVGTSLKLAPSIASVAPTGGSAKPNPASAHNLNLKISSSATTIAHNLPATLKFTNSAAHPGSTTHASSGLNSAQLLSNSWGLSAFIHQTTTTTTSTASSTLSHPIKTTQQNSFAPTEISSTSITTYVASGVGPVDTITTLSRTTMKSGEDINKPTSGRPIKNSPPSTIQNTFKFVSQPSSSQNASQSVKGDASISTPNKSVSTNESPIASVVTSTLLSNKTQSSDGRSPVALATTPSSTEKVPEILVEFPIASITHETVAPTKAVIDSNINLPDQPDEPTSPPVANEQSDSHKIDKSDAAAGHKPNSGERFFKRSNKESRPSHKLNASSTHFKYNTSVAAANGNTKNSSFTTTSVSNSVFDSTFAATTSNPSDGYQPVVMEERAGAADTSNIDLMASVALIVATSGQHLPQKGHPEDKPTTSNQATPTPVDDYVSSGKQQFSFPHLIIPAPDKIVPETTGDKIPTTPTPSISSSSDLQSTTDHVKGDWEKPLKKRSTNPTLPESQHLQLQQGSGVDSAGLLASSRHNHPQQQQHPFNAWYQQLLKLEQGGAPATTNPLQSIPHNFPFLPNNHHAHHPYAPLSGGERFGHHLAALSQYNAMLKAAAHQASTAPAPNYLYRPVAATPQDHNHYHPIPTAVTPASSTSNIASCYAPDGSNSQSSQNNLVPHDDNSALHPSFLHQPPTYFDSYAGGRLIPNSSGAHNHQQTPHATPSFKPYDNNNATLNPNNTLFTTPNHSTPNAAAMMLINEYSQAQMPTPSQVAAAAYNYFPYLVQHGFHPHHPYFGHMMSSGPTAPTHHPHQMSSWLSAVMAAGNTSPLSDHHHHHPLKGKQSGLDPDLKSNTSKSNNTSTLVPSMQSHPHHAVAAASNYFLAASGHRGALNTGEESFHHNNNASAHAGRQSMPHNYHATLALNNRKFVGGGGFESGAGPCTSLDRVTARASSVNVAAISGGGAVSYKPPPHHNNPLLNHYQGSSSVGGHRSMSHHYTMSSPLSSLHPQPPHDLRAVFSSDYVGIKQQPYCQDANLYGGGGSAIENNINTSTSTSSKSKTPQPSPPPPFNIPRMMTNAIPLNYGSLDKK